MPRIRMPTCATCQAREDVRQCPVCSVNVCFECLVLLDNLNGVCKHQQAEPLVSNRDWSFRDEVARLKGWPPYDTDTSG